MKGEAAAMSVRAQRCQSHYLSTTPRTYSKVAIASIYLRNWKINAKTSFRISYVTEPKPKPKPWNSEHKFGLLESETLILCRQILFLRHLNLIYLLYNTQAQFVLIFLPKKNASDVTILCVCVCVCVCVSVCLKYWTDFHKIWYQYTRLNVAQM